MFISAWSIKQTCIVAYITLCTGTLSPVSQRFYKFEVRLGTLEITAAL